MKVLLINGSPHKNGETASALSVVGKSLQENGIDTFWLQIGNQPVRGCINCCSCEKTNRCVFTDDKCDELI